jgi:anti-sigma factor RsiW
MDCEHRISLSAYHDGELDQAAARETEWHVKACPACAAELAEIRALSRAFGRFATDPMSREGVAQAHAAAEAAALRAPVLRVAGVLIALAASVLVVGSAWLMEPVLPGYRTTPVAVVPAPTPDWERVAMTLNAAPLAVEAPDAPQPLLLADAATDQTLADWMLRNLGVGSP